MRLVWQKFTSTGKGCASCAFSPLILAVQVISLNGAPLVLLAQRIFLCVKRQLIVTRHLHNSRARFYYAAKVLCDGSSRWSRPYWVLYPGGMKQRNEIPSEEGKGVGDLCFIRERSDIGTSRYFWPRWTWPRHLPCFAPKKMPPPPCAWTK